MLQGMPNIYHPKFKRKSWISLQVKLQFMKKIGDAKFYILIDETQGELKSEQMTYFKVYCGLYV